MEGLASVEESFKGGMTVTSSLSSQLEWLRMSNPLGWGWGGRVGSHGRMLPKQTGEREPEDGLELESLNGTR